MAIKPYEFDEIIVSKVEYAKAIADARADGYAEATADAARGLRNLADGFHFAGDLPAEKTLRNWIAVALKPAVKP